MTTETDDKKPTHESRTWKYERSFVKSTVEVPPAKQVYVHLQSGATEVINADAMIFEARCLVLLSGGKATAVIPWEALHYTTPVPEAEVKA